MAALNPIWCSNSLAPQEFARPFFRAVFIRVTHDDGLSERGATPSLPV